MRRVDEEMDFLVRYFSLFSQNNDAESNDGNYCQYDCIDQHGPETEPNGLGNTDFHGTFFEYDTFIFVRDCTDMKGILSRTQIGETDDVFISGTAPLVVKSFQLPWI